MLTLVGAVAVAMLLMSGTEQQAARAQADQLYVDAASRGGPCSDTRLPEQVGLTTPWCTLSRAVEAAPPGSRILVRGGSYPALTVTGQRSPAITVSAVPGETASIDGVTFTGAAGVVLENLVFTRGIDVAGASHDLVVSRSRLLNSNIFVRPGAQRLTFEGNSITAPRSNGIIFSAAGGAPVEDVTIKGNSFDDIGIVGMNLRNFRRVRVEGNTLRRVHSWDGVVHPDVIRTYAGGEDLVINGNYLTANNAQGIFTKDGRVDRLTITNNVIVRNGKWLALNLWDAHDVLIANNTIVDNRGGAIVHANATGVDLRNNILQSLTIDNFRSIAYEDYNYIRERKGDEAPLNAITGLRGANDLASGIRFVDAAAGDYRLVRGTAGIDRGTATRAPATDRQGRARIDMPDSPNRASIVDLGAEEHQPDPPEAPPGGPAVGVSPPRFQISLAPAQRQRLRRRRGLRAAVGCNQSCAVVVTARVRIGRRVRSSKTVRFNAEAGSARTVTLRFGPRVARQIRARLRRSGSMRATIFARGNSASRTPAFSRARIMIVQRLGDPSKAFAVRVVAPPPQRLRRGRDVRARVRCTVRCLVRVRARVRDGRRIAQSRTTSRWLRAGRSVSVRTRFGPRVARQLRRRLDRGRTIRMTVVATGTDDLGRNSASATRIRVRGH